MTSQEIRRQFIDFFVQKHGHTFVPSSSVAPHDDPTLLFTNAGMNQFKPLFLGMEKRPYARAVNTQKCIRAGGKHNDLDDVGRSRRHHTFFEMLGNWSFGDYFKREAIEWAWELLTGVWKLDPTRLHVTCYEGDEKNGVPRDIEAANLWKEIAKLPDNQIHYFGKDNFWEMGDTGPCGPCSEIYIDRTPEKTGGKDVNGDDPRVMEIWNLVFIQYNRNADRSLTPLPAKHVDTGMGFERICQVIQGKDDNYGIDLFVPFFDAISRISNCKYTGQYPKSNAADPVAESANPQLRYDIAFRVIADHVRCLTFALTDGAVPSNEGRGYVLRRILRRAVRFGRQQLDLREPFMHKLVPVVVESMGGAFPELKKNPQRVIELIRDEEVSFGKTLDRGIALFQSAAIHAASLATDKSRFAFRFNPESQVAEQLEDEQDRKMSLADGRLPLTPDSIVYFVDRETRRRMLAMHPAQQFNASDIAKFLNQPLTIGADDAFRLHDTYGFPIDLTQIMAAERGMTIDIAGYEKLMEEAREKARAGGKAADSAVLELPPAALAELSKSSVKPTDDSAKFKFEPIRARVMAIWNGSNLDPSADTSADQEVAVILDRTNFYAEMGGQVGDSGTIGSLTPSPCTQGEGRGEGSSIANQKSQIENPKAPLPHPLPEYGEREQQAQLDVETTRSFGGFVLHIGRVRSGSIQVGDEVTATVSASRKPTMQNHTGTHLANWALREVLGDDVQQKGSLVDPEKLRFDYSHGKSMSDDEIIRVEKLVNESIARKLPVYAEEAPQQDALKINGLRAVFGEKYPPMVRVVSIGSPVNELLKNLNNPQWRQYSIEFCGGTHLKNSSEVENFVITSEESVSKGIRRIVAHTGDRAKLSLEVARTVDQAIATAQAMPEMHLPPMLATLQKQLSVEGLPLRVKRRGQAIISQLQQKHKAWEKSQKSSGGASIDVSAVASGLIDQGKIIVASIDGANDEQLRAVLDSIKKRTVSFGVMLGATDGQKVTFVAAVSDDLIAKGLKAGDWIRETAKVAGGGGGGRPQMAQAGGKDPAKLADALEVARKYAAERAG